MYGECELSCRLTYKEIIYLAASIGAEEIYGLKREPDSEPADKEATAAEWEIIKSGLCEKNLLKQKNGELVLEADIYETIRTISYPRLFLVAKCKDELIDSNRNYYFAGHLSVKLEYDTVNRDAYMLTRYDNPVLLKESLQSFFRFNSRPFADTNQSVSLGIEELKNFLQAITDNDSERQLEILYRQGLDKEYVEDIAKALEEKNCLRTMLVISFSEAAQSIVKEYIMYGGGKNLWQIEFRNTKAYIESISNEAIDYKMSVLADVLFYL